MKFLTLTLTRKKKKKEREREEQKQSNFKKISSKTPENCHYSN